MAKTVALAVVSDEHINSTIALCTPSVALDEGGTYRASRTQCAIYESWIDYWKEFGKLKVDEKVTVFNGDLGETVIGRSKNQIITSNPATVFKMLIDVLEPALAQSDKVYITRGTPFHTGPSGWIEELVASDIDVTVPSTKSKELDPVTGKPLNQVYSWWQVRKKAADVKFDIAHHGQMGYLPWTEKHAGLRLAERTLWRYMITRKIDPPDVVLRSHKHVYADSGGNYDETLAIFTPCWSSMTEFAYRTNRENDLPTIGGLWFVCKDGDFTYKKMFYQPLEVKRIWTVEAEF